MRKTINFNRLTWFTGRNGSGKCSGIDLFALKDDKLIMVSPITSKDKIGRCNIAIPKGSVSDVIKMLNEITQEL